MKKVLLARKLISVLLLLASALAAVLTLRTWAPPLLQFLGANADTIQALEAAIQIILWLVIATSFLLGARHVQTTRTPSSPPSSQSSFTPLQSVHRLVDELRPAVARLGLGVILDYRLDLEAGYLLLRIRADGGVHLLRVALSEVWHHTPEEIARLLEEAFERA